MTDVSIPMRPRTANPKLESLNLAENALLHSSHPSFNVPSPPATQRGAGGFGEGSVIWSQDTVPLEELSRPHTSNPRYVEMTTQKLETPRRSSPQQRHDTPSRTSQADTTSAVLWASDAQDISPAMLARPLTSNPWLTRFLDGVPADIKSDNTADASGRRSGAGEILWSDKEIEDWRLLARPHASNPVYEASVAASRNVVKPVTDVSGVLWSSEDLSSDEVFQLRAVVESQQQRIKELEAHVAMLQEQMRAFATNAGMTPLVQSVEVLRLSGVHDTLSPAVEGVVGAPQAATHAARPGTAASGRRDVASHESTPLDNLTPVRPTPTRHTAVPTARTPPYTDEHSSPSQAPYARASTSLGYRPGEGHDNDDDDEGNAADEVIQPGSPTEPTAAAPAPLPAATPAREVEFIVEDDNADVDDSVFSKVASSNAPSRFASKLRDTTGQSRPDTAGIRRGAPFEGAVAPPRPSSAPAARAAKRFDAVPASFPSLVSEALVAEASIGAAYDALRLPGSAFVSKESFRRMYMARAAEFGTPCTKTTLDRLLRPYRSKGDDVLSLEEFAVLYLQLQRW